MRTLTALLIVGCATLAGCAMTVDTTVISRLDDYRFRIEDRSVRDASYMWDDSEDVGEIWAINEGDATICVTLRNADGYSSDWTVPPHQSMRLLQGRSYSGQVGARVC